MALLDEQPYIGYPQMGRRRVMPNRDVEMNQGLLRGASYYPTDLLGSPIDLINMALKPIGLGSQKPVMGSEYLQNVAQQYGLLQKPTGSNAENVARLAISAMNPATGARAVGKVVEPTMQALAPKAYDMLENYMVKSGGMIPLTAYHGTPHTIQGKFDINKMGTGEGNQSYGAGMYFAENPAVAKEYQKMLRGPESTAQHYLDLYKTPESAISAIQYEIKPNLTAEAKKHSLDAIEVLKSGKELKGNLYKVDIPDEYIPKMLDWDKPLKDQTSQVQKALAKANPKFYDPKSPDYDPNESGKWIYMSIAGNITPDAQKIASAQLNELGIKGVRYKDAMSRGGDDGTSNFVVFDPSTVNILEKNDQPIGGLLY